MSKKKAIRTKITDVNYKYNINENIVDDKKNIIILNRYFQNKNKVWGKYSYNIKQKLYDYKCNICGFVNYSVMEESINRNGCPCCSNKKTVHGINDITTTDPWMIKYFIGGYEEAKLYASHSNKKIKIKCPYCGNEKNIQICKLKARGSISCTCGDNISYPEKFFLSLLEQTEIDYDYQKRYDWCLFYNPYKNKKTRGRYDFVIEKLKLIIETDGLWHKQDNNLSGQSKEESAFIDNEKDRLAKMNNYTVLRIDCSVSSKDYIINSIYDSGLNKYIDLALIDYNKCDFFAKSNIRKKVLEDYLNTNLTAIELSKKYEISCTCICGWLKNEGIDPKLRANNLKRGISNINRSKRVEISTDGINYKLYDSVVMLYENFENDYGCKGNLKSIYRALKNNKHYKGKFIRYVT